MSKLCKKEHGTRETRESYNQQMKINKSKMERSVFVYA